MKGQKPPAQIERPRRESNRISVARNNAGLVLALVGLVSAALMNVPIKPVSAQTVKGSWSHTGNLNTSRVYHKATLLPDGKVLVVGGSSGSSDDEHPFASAELYDPSTGTWSFTGSLNVSRGGYTATLLANGKVLVAGGFASDSDDLKNTAELYDPATGEWSFTGNLNVPRRGHTATLLPNGKVLVAGGGLGGAFSATDTAELYDPATGEWSLTGKLSGARTGHAATLLQDGKVLVAGGCGGKNCKNNLGSAELFDPNTETWSFTGSPNTLRIVHTLTTLLNGNVLMSGGGGSGSLTAEIYNPATGRWSLTGSFRHSHIGETITLLASGQVLVLGGWTDEEVFAELYNPATGKWNTTASPNTTRNAHTATLLSDGKLLVAGGYEGAGNGSAELYDPETLDPVPTAPRIISASVSGKKLLITGENFHDGAVILLKGQEQKSKNDAQNPQTTLIGKRAGKKIKAGDRLRVRNPDGTISEEFVFTGL